MLGIIREDKEIIMPWLNSQEKIVYVSRKIPIIISYNLQSDRHSFHMIKVNLQENEKDNTKLSF